MNIFKRRPPPANRAERTDMAPPHQKRIAIVGSGCAGLGAAWALKDTDYDVHIFEKSSTLGGHTNTQPFRHGDKTIQVDTGFIVMNQATYPNFLNFLKYVGIDPVDTEMTFGVSRNHGEFEWSGEGKGIFAQRRNIFRPQHYRLIFDIIRFNQFALDLIADDPDAVGRIGSSAAKKQQDASLTIGQYLDREGYSQAFRDDYLIPMTAAVWSTSPDKASLEFPAQTLIRFMWNHHLLSTLAERPPWLTIVGGSQRYIDAILEQFPKDRLHVHTRCEVAKVLRPDPKSKGPVAVTWLNAKDGKIEQETFEHVILACHGDEILPILSKHGSKQKSPVSSSDEEDSVKYSRSNSSKASSFASPTRGVQYVSQEEHAIFSAFQTTKNVCYLHSDLAHMPTRRATWTAWNYLVNSKPSEKPHPAGVSLTYNMNILQHYPEDTYGHVLVTMNPDKPPKPTLTQGTFHYTHPLYTVESVRAQTLLENIQNTRGVSYCGAWTKYGFHEDGFSSGLRVATEHLGAKLPFDFVDSTYSRGHRPSLIWKDYLLRLILIPILFGIRFLMIVLGLPLIVPVVDVLSIWCSRLLDFGEYVGLL